MTRFVAVYEGLTVSSARLLALNADERIVRKFFEELLAEPEEDTPAGTSTPVLELPRERQE